MAESKPEAKTTERLSKNVRPLKSYVEYVGGATNRVITRAEFASIGIQAEKDHEWNFVNKFRLPEERFSDDELSYLLDKDGRFKLVEG